MRALLLCLALAACQPAAPNVTAEQIQAELSPPAPSAADNIAAIGAEAMCERDEAITDHRDGVAVTYCAPAQPPRGMPRLLASADD